MRKAFRSFQIDLLTTNNPICRDSLILSDDNLHDDQENITKTKKGESKNYYLLVEASKVTTPIITKPETDSGLVKLVVMTNVFFNNQQHEIKIKRFKYVKQIRSSFFSNN